MNDGAAAGQSMSHANVHLICERAQSLGGTFAIERAPGGGTRISVRLPLQTVPDPIEEPDRQTVM